MQRKVIKTDDGSRTLYVPELEEHYHSRFGAITESKQIYINAAFRYFDGDPVRVFEFGMGTGLNVLLTYQAAQELSRTVHYVTIEKYPVTQFELENLSFCDHFDDSCQKVLLHVHECEWGSEQSLSDSFTLQKVEGDFKHFRSEHQFNVIYYDAFAPEVQPDLWTEEIFRKVASIAAPGSILTTYSCKGLVKRNLKAAGFSIEKLPGPPGKREFIRAIRKT